MHIRYASGRTVEVTLLSCNGNTLRVLPWSSDEALELHEDGGFWIDSDGELVRLEFAPIRDSVHVAEIDRLGTREATLMAPRFSYGGDDLLDAALEMLSVTPLPSQLVS